VDISPFPYQGPLEPGQVRARHELAADLLERITEHRVTALLGPRRYGKTSVLRRVAADIEAAGPVVVWADLYEVSSMADLAARLDDGLGGVGGSSGDRLSRIAAGASLNLGLIRVELRSPSRSRPDPLLTVHTQMDVLTALARSTPVVLIFDEFSSIKRVDGAAGLLRTHLQPFFQTLGLVFAGSEPSMMQALFTDQAEPFYAQADLIEIGPLTAAEVVDLVTDGFTETGRSAGPLPHRIAELGAGHPQRSMQLADTAWRLVTLGDAATASTWDDTLHAIRGATANGLERLYSSLRDGEKDVLRIVASGGSIFGTAAELLDLSTGSAQHARRALLDRGHLHRDDDGLRLVDPIFADWIRERFPL